MEISKAFFIGYVFYFWFFDLILIYMRHLICTLSVFFLFTVNSFAQTAKQNTGWFLFLNSTRLNEKWGLHLDVQLRSADQWDGVRNTLVRPGITYFINKSSNATVGYLHVNTYFKQDGASNNTLTEHRIWEQYIFAHKIKPVFVQHRFRLEQRFIETTGNDIFSQRLRYFFRAVLPVLETKAAFAKGPFVALQNELFFNIQNKAKLNGEVFDQNRAYGAVGYRFSKKVDLEAGYLNQFVNGAVSNTMNNALQIAVYTRF